MSYNRIRTPRAYVDKISRDLSNGYITNSQFTTVRNDGNAFLLEHGHILDLFDLKPHRYVKIPKETKRFYIQFDTKYSSEPLGESNFVAILGHNMFSANVNFAVQTSDSETFSSNVQTVSDADYTGFSALINCQADGANNAWISPQLNGYSLFTWTDSGDSSQDNRYVRFTFIEDPDPAADYDEDLYIGSIMYGEYLDFPANADVGYSIAYDYDESTRKRAIGGSDYSTITHYGSPMWPTTLSNSTYSSTTNIGSTSNNPYDFMKRAGRKKISMNFSNVADTNIFPEHETSSGSYLDSDIFHSALYQQLAGSHLPFLFGYDNTSTHSSDYGLYRLANSLNAKQVAANTFNFKMDLEEAW